MEGVKFDTEKLKRGLPIRWRLPIDRLDCNDRFGLITDCDESHITILAVNARHEMKFIEKKYSIEEIDEFEVLGDWDRSNGRCCVGDPPF